jgi:hypothetical protein
MQHLQQLRNIVKMQTGCRLIEDIQGLTGITLGQLTGQFNPLRLTTGQRSSILTQLDITQTHIHQSLQLARHHRHRLIKAQRILNGHLQNLMDIATLIANIQRFAVIALTLALITGHINIRQEMHRHLNHPIALTGLAPPTLDVETETARLITPRP